MAHGGVPSAITVPHVSQTQPTALGDRVSRGSWNGRDQRRLQDALGQKLKAVNLMLTRTAVPTPVPSARTLRPSPQPTRLLWFHLRPSGCPRSVNVQSPGAGAASFWDPRTGLSAHPTQSALPSALEQLPYASGRELGPPDSLAGRLSLNHSEFT